MKYNVCFQTFLAFIPLLSAFLGAMVGSIFTHILQLIKDNRIESKKTCRKIYYKIFPELKYFFLNDNSLEKPVYSERKVNDLKNKIENTLEENIDFLDKKLFSIYYYNLKSDEYIESLGYSVFININHLETFSNILSCMYSIIKKTDMFARLTDKKLLKDIDELSYCYKFWFLLMENFQNWTFVDQILQSRCLYKKTFKEIYTSKQINKLLNNRNIDDEIFYEYFLKYCIDDINIPKGIFKDR